MSQPHPVIVVIEDDPQIRRFLRTGLEAHGFEIHEAETGKLGLILAATRKPDLIILDLGLPDVDGIEIIKKLREWTSRPVIILSARNMETDKVAALDIGADDYLTKPFAFEELLARIEALLRRGREQRVKASSLQVADLVLDRERMQVTRAGQPIALTAKELAFLELLMSAPGRVYSRERILSNVWGTNEDPLTNVVDVYVRRLRAKIDEGHPLALLKTVRGFGYRLDAQEA